MSGYEIHHGRTTLGAEAEPLMSVAGEPAGAAREAVWGCYLHGAFGDDELRAAWLASLRGSSAAVTRWEAHLDAELDRLADAVEASLDMDAVDRMIGFGGRWG